MYKNFEEKLMFHIILYYAITFANIVKKTTEKKKKKKMQSQ